MEGGTPDEEYGHHIPRFWEDLLVEMSAINPLAPTTGKDLLNRQMQYVAHFGELTDPKLEMHRLREVERLPQNAGYFVPKNELQFALWQGLQLKRDVGRYYMELHQQLNMGHDSVTDQALVQKGNQIISDWVERSYVIPQAVLGIPKDVFAAQAINSNPLA